MVFKITYSQTGYPDTKLVNPYFLAKTKKRSKTSFLLGLLLVLLLFFVCLFGKETKQNNYKIFNHLDEIKPKKKTPYVEGRIPHNTGLPKPIDSCVISKEKVMVANSTI